MFSVRKLLAASLLAAVFGAASADVYEASFDGGWFDPAQGGRGVLVDYIAQAGGNGSYFITLYTDRGPLWTKIVVR